MTPQQPKIFRGGCHCRGTLRLMKQIFGGRHQQIGPFGERNHQQRRATDIEPCVVVTNLRGQ